MLMDLIALGMMSIHQLADIMTVLTLSQAMHAVLAKNQMKIEVMMVMIIMTLIVMTIQQ
jgi:hypothetical protein